MNLNGIVIQNYIYHFFREMDNLYSVRDKVLVFMTYEPNINNAKALIELGAKKVYFLNPDYSYTEIDNGKVILINEFELCRLEDKSIDLILGIEILEHINDLERFFFEIKRISKSTGDIELQGNPMWTSPFGHHLWIENKYIFYEKSNPFEPWEHLIYANKEEMRGALIKKGLPVEDCDEIVDWIYNPIEISRHTPTEIIEAVTHIPAGAEKGGISYSRSAMFEIYRTDSWIYSFKRCYNRVEPNEYYEKALEAYSEHDLKTGSFVLKMKKLNENTSDDDNIEKIDLSSLDTAISDIIGPLSEKHNIKGAKVLNLSLYEHELISKVFVSLGAESVTSVHPKPNTEKSEYIKEHTQFFEDFDTTNQHFDIVFGLDTLNKILDLNKFCINLKKVTDLSSTIYLSGFTPYTSACGHKIYTENHHFIDDTNPFEHWEHLQLKTKEQFAENLQAKNLSEQDIRFIIDQYFENGNVFDYTPTEIENKFKNYLNVHMYRIYHYLPKNKFYEKALERYSEDDLNVERIIITSDLPTLYWLHELELDPYIEAGLSDIHMKYVLTDKRVLNITPYIQYEITEGLESLRPREVVSLDSHYSGFELRGGKNVTRVNQKIEDLENLPGKFDIIYGLDVLEHVKDVKKFFINLRNLVADKGVICLQGSPLWPSDNGFNYHRDDLDCGVLTIGHQDLTLEPWEHLAYETKEELKNAMLKKKFTEHDAEAVSEYIFNSDEINRLAFSDFIRILDEVDGVFYGSKKILNYTEENEFYEKACERYTHEELRTKELKLNIRKKLH